MKLRAKLIYNPTSGKELLSTKLSEVITKLSKNDFIVEVAPTHYAGHARVIAEESCDEPIDLIIASGGDGTLNEVISGMSVKEKRPTLGYIPSGTTNDFARAVGIGLSFNDAIDNILNGEKVKIDVAKINEHYFINIGCFGPFTKVSYETSSSLKTILGHSAYIINGVKELPSILDMTDVELEIDGKLVEQSISGMFVANTNNFAGFKDIIPKASVSDGYLDILTLSTRNPKFFLEFIKSFRSGITESIDNNGFFHVKAKTVKIKSKNEKKIKWNLDGEYGFEGDALIECIPGHIEFIMPKDSKVK